MTNKKSNKVIIIGAGVAGLSAAQELSERGFEVEVFEIRDIPGGKARSMYVKGTGVGGRGDLPAEHGFRFFPGFYKHLFDTMRRIPYKANPNGVYDNLVGMPYMIAATDVAPPINIPLHFPKDIRDAILLANLPGELYPLDIPTEEVEFYLNKVWQFWTSSKIRRINEYEQISWWDYIDAENKSEKYRQYLARGQTTQLVAGIPEKASTRTIGEVGFKLILNAMTPGQGADKVLNGPTNDVWIDPWVDYLKNLGVQFNFEHKLDKILLNDNKISGFALTDIKTNSKRNIEGDYFVLTLPIEVLIKYLTPEILKLAPDLSGLQELSKMKEWMNGIMFYLKEPLSIENGHLSFLDSKWALTAVSQTKSWSQFDFSKSSDGLVKDILSVDIADWNSPGILYNKVAKDCTAEEISKEVWEQMKQSLNLGEELLKDENLHSWFLDPDIMNVEDNPHQNINLEPIIINQVDSWKLRPSAHTGIENLFIAGDYVKTHTDLATMETSNESARRVVNKILELTKADAPPARIWFWDRPLYLKPFTLYDAWRFKRGLEWKNAPWVVTLVYKALLLISKYI